MSNRGFKLMREFEAHSAEVKCLSIGRKSGLVFATGSEDRKVNTWSLTKSQAISSLSGHTSSVECVSFDPGEEIIAAGSFGGTIKLWDLESQKVVRTLSGHKASVATVDFHPFGEYLATGSNDTTVKLWDIKSRSCIITYRGNNEPITFVRFTPDGRWVVSGTETGQVVVWDLSTAKILHTFNDHTAPVRWVHFHPHEFLLATGSDDRTVKFYDIETFEMISSTDPDLTRVNTVTFTPDGRGLLAGFLDSLKVLTWEPASVLDSVSVNWGSRLLDSAVVRDQFVGCSATGSRVSVWVLPMQKLRFGGETQLEDTMSDTLRRINDTHRPMSRAKRAVESGSPQPPENEEQPLEIHGAPVVPQAAPWGRQSQQQQQQRIGTAGGVIHVHSSDGIGASPRSSVISPPPVPSSAPAAAPARPQMPSVPAVSKSSREMVPPGSRRRAVREDREREATPPPQSPPPPVAEIAKVVATPREIDIHSMVAQVPREPDTVGAVQMEIENTHKDIMLLLGSRLHSIRTVRALWAVNVKSAIEEMTKLNDSAVVADIIKVMLKKPELFNLERAVLLIPFVDDLLNSQYEELVLVALNTLMLFATSFGPLIRTNLEVPSSGGIDFSREERTERCITLATAFKKTQPRLAALARRGKRLGEPARALAAKLRENGLD